VKRVEVETAKLRRDIAICAAAWSALSHYGTPDKHMIEALTPYAGKRVEVISRDDFCVGVRLQRGVTFRVPRAFCAEIETKLRSPF